MVIQAQRPTLVGYTDGIVGVDPMEVQCRECGHIETQPEESSAGVFILMCGMRFCTIDKVRRCRGCRATHTPDCAKCQEVDR